MIGVPTPDEWYAQSLHILLVCTLDKCQFLMQGSAHSQASQQQSDASLAASCDRTHLYIIWGLTPLPPALVPATRTPPVGQASGSRSDTTGSSQHYRRGSNRDSAQAGSSRLHSGAGSLSKSAGAAAENTDHNLTDRDSVLRHGDFRGLTGPDDLVASLRRLRPHLHASEPFSPQSAGPAAARPASDPANRSVSPSDGSTGSATAQTGSGATGSSKDPGAQSTVECGLSGSREYVSYVGQSACKEAMGSCTAGVHSQHGMPAADPAAARHAVPAAPGLSNAAAYHSVFSQASTSLNGVATTEHEEPESSCSADEAQRAQHDTACPPWPLLKAAHTAQQLKALYQCCNTVACFDVFEVMSDTVDQTQSSQPKDARPAQQCFKEQPQQHKGCRTQPLWSHAVIAAAHLSAGDGAVVVACSDGMLLLLDQANGKLIRYFYSLFLFHMSGIIIMWRAHRLGEVSYASENHVQGTL